MGIDIIKRKGNYTFVNSLDMREFSLPMSIKLNNFLNFNKALPWDFASVEVEISTRLLNSLCLESRIMDLIKLFTNYSACRLPSLFSSPIAKEVYTKVPQLALSTLWTSTYFLWVILRESSFYLCVFWKTWASFHLNNSSKVSFHSPRYFLFDSLFIFLQFIEKVSAFYMKFVGKSSHLSKKFPWRSLPRVGKLFSFSFNFPKIKRMFLPLPSWEENHCKWAF